MKCYKHDDWNYRNIPTKRELEYLGLCFLVLDRSKALKFLTMKSYYIKQLLAETIEREGYDNPTT